MFAPKFKHKSSRFAIALCISIILASFASSFASQDLDMDLFHHCRWKEFENNARAYIAAGNETQPHYFTELAIAQESQRKFDEAEKTLREGIKKHPNDPLCYSTLAAWLSIKGGDRKNRKEAISLYETTIKKAAGSEFNTYDYVPKELSELKKFPPEKSFPPISPTVKSAADSMLSCGFFQGWSAKDVYYNLALSVGSAVSKPVDPYMIEAIADLDSRHFRNVPTQFYTEVEMKMVSALGKEHGFSARYISEKMIGSDGTREIEVEVDKQRIKARIKDSRQLLGLINKALEKTSCKKRFYFLSAEDAEEQCMGFLDAQQVSCLKSKELFKRPLCCRSNSS